MAKDELESITEDKWDEDIWGIEHADSDGSAQISKLIFYFAEHVSVSTGMICDKNSYSYRTTGYRTTSEMS